MMMAGRLTARGVARVTQRQHYSFSNNSGNIGTFKSQLPISAVATTGIISFISFSVASSSRVGLKEQKIYSPDSDTRSQSRVPSTPHVRVYTGHGVADEAKQLHDEINNLVAKHGEKRIRNLLSRRLQAQANNMSTEQEETISLGEIDPKLLSRETLQDLIEALQQGARFDEASLTKLYQVVSSGSNS